MIKRIKCYAGGFCIAAILIGTTWRAQAATFEEAQRLNTAYPPGSVVVCRSDLPGDGKMLRRPLVTTRGTVITRRNNLTDYDVKVTWLTEGANSSGMTLTFRSTERAEQSGVYLRIDPDTMAVSLPGASHEEKNNLLDGFRTRFGGSEHFASYTETEITDFPSYIYRKPGEPTAYCHKEQSGH